MTIAELIEELRKYSQYQPVRVVVRDGMFDVTAEVEMDAEGELKEVRFQGNHVLLEAE